jgi:hypothetical protein
LTFVGPSGGNYSVEASSDMRTWAPVTATITEVRPGEYQVAIEGVQKSVRFFRVRDARPQPYPSSTYRAKP